MATESLKSGQSQRTADIADRFDTGELLGKQVGAGLGKLPLLGAFVGLLVGVIGVAFFTISELARSYLFGSVGGMNSGAEAGGWYAAVAHMLPEPNLANPAVWLLVALPAAGGLLVGLWYRLTHDDTQAGTEVAIRVFHQDRGRFPAWFMVKKFVASCLTLGSGGAAGREGPIALIGATIGSSLATRFGLTQRQRRILLVAGMAAGVGGMFRAPLAGGLFAAEVLYSDAEFEPDVLIPGTLASIVSYCVFCVNFGWGSLFGKVAADYSFRNPLELVPLTALACLLALAGYAYVKAQHVTESRLRKIPRWIRPMIGGAVAGTIALALYLGSSLFSTDGRPDRALFAVMGDGYSALRTALQGGGIWWVLLLLALGKMLASAFTVGSGGAGGYFAPSMVIGGAVGAAVGMIFYQLLPGGFLPAPSTSGEMASVTAVFALVGMAGFWTGVAKVPVSSVIIVCELTGSYHLLLPAMWTCAITFVLSRRYKLYLSQVASRRDSAAHRGDFSVNVLREIRVSDLLPELKNFEAVSESTSLKDILGMHASRQAYFPVLARDGHFVGIFSLNDLRAVLGDSQVWQLLVAADIVREEVVTVRPSQTLAEVASTFAETSYDELPVVADDDSRKLVGMISRRQLNNAYIKRTMLYDQAARMEHSTAGVSGRQP